MLILLSIFPLSTVKFMFVKKNSGLRKITTQSTNYEMKNVKYDFT